jgi:hypothetical protein
MKRLTNLTSLHLKSAPLKACLYSLDALTKLEHVSLGNIEVQKVLPIRRCPVWRTVYLCTLIYA